MRSDTFILLATQKNASDDDPATDAIYTIGTLASVLQLLKLPDGTVKVLVEGAARAQVTRYTDREDYYEADAVVLADSAGDQVEAEALARSVVNEFEGYVKLNKKVSPEVVGVVQQIDDYAKLADTVASHLAVKIPDKQIILETPSVTERLEKVLGLMESEISVLQVEKRIRTRVKRQMEKTQREYYLNEQMKAIQKELGDEDGKDELAELEEKIKRTKLSKEAREKAQHELKKLRQMSPMSAEATVVRNYLDWLLSIPWNKKSKIKKDLDARRADSRRRSLRPGEGQGAHRRIPRRAAARQQADRPDPVPGRSARRRQDLARQVDRQGDRARVRAHLARRRARRGGDPRPPADLYRLDARQDHPVDAQGEERRIRCSCSTRSTRWAPISAATRHRRCSKCSIRSRTSAFNDHYLEVDYDLSNVMFITTANTLNIPPPLMDRMEIIRIAGYTEDEKIEIARKHLIPHAVVKHGLKPKRVDDRRRCVAHPYSPLHAGSGRAQSRARDFDADPQGGEGSDHLEEADGPCRRKGPGRLSRGAEIPLR